LAPVNKFVEWHHVACTRCVLLSVISIIPDVKRARTRRLALSYIVAFGLLGEWMFVTPYLPKLWNDSRCLISGDRIVRAARLARPHRPRRHVLAPALNDGVRADPSAPSSFRERDRRRVSLVGASRSNHRAIPAITNGGGWAMAAAWSLALHLTAFMVTYAVVRVIGASGRATMRPRHWE
jgi:hypothetical protein